MRLTKIGALALTATLATSGLAACGSSKKSASSGGGTIGNCALTGTKGQFKITPVVAGQLTVQTSLPAPGWFNGDNPDSIKDGYEYCLAANVAYRAGISKVVVQNVDFTQLVAAGTKGFDFALAEISITDKRKQVVDFSVPYFASDIGALVKKGVKVTDTASLKALKIGVQEATTGGDFVMAKIQPGAKVFPDSASMFTALDSGSIDVAMTDTSIVLAQAGQSKGALEVVGQYQTGESYGALYPKGAANNAEWDKAIKSLLDDKTTDKLSDAYLKPAFSGDPAKVPYFKV